LDHPRALETYRATLLPPCVISRGALVAREWFNPPIVSRSEATNRNESRLNPCQLKGLGQSGLFIVAKATNL
jgi:hypothetical protein